MNDKLVNNKHTQRTRTITWEDTTVSAEAGRSMNGLEYLCAVKDGKIPTSPFGRLLGYRLAAVAKGHVAFELEPAEYHCNPTGTVHGGVASSLLDSAMGAAVQTMLAKGISYSTVELKVNLIRPLTPRTKRVRCMANTIHLGNRIATTEGRLVDEQDKLYAHATATFMILRPTD